jgi:phosphoglycerate dehydrogenase-like enzyme
MPWRVLITAQAMARSGQAAITRLREAGHELIFPIQPGLPTPDELGGLLPGVDAVIAGVERYDEPIFALPATRDLKLISRWGVGYDSINIPAATRAGVAIAYTPGLLNETVADYAFSLLCSVARRVYCGHLELAQGKWVPSWGHNIHDKTLGLVGCGRIGLAVARRASGFNMRVLAVDPQPSEEARKLGVQFVDLDTLLQESDFVSLHAALIAQTRGLMGEAQFRRMKSSAYLINTSRGAILDEAALAKALHQGVIAGAALDTFQVEPLPKDHVLHGVPNLLLTPHQASFTRETGALVSEAAAQAVLEAAQGRRPRWLVDESVLNSASLRMSQSSIVPPPA